MPKSFIKIALYTIYFELCQLTSYTLGQVLLQLFRLFLVQSSEEQPYGPLIELQRDERATYKTLTLLDR